MGVMWFRVTVHGSGAHVQKAHEAVNAIEKSFILVSALRRLEARMNSRISRPLYRNLEHPINLNLGKIRGGDWPSNVPALCEFECRISYPPGVDPSQVRQEIEECLRDGACADPWLAKTPPSVTYFGFRAHGSEVDKGNALVKLLERCHHDCLSEEMEFGISTACDDTRYFNNNFGTPVVAYGPKGGGFHGPDEYVELDSIVTGARVLASFVMEWCGVEE